MKFTSKNVQVNLKKGTIVSGTILWPLASPESLFIEEISVHLYAKKLVFLLRHFYLRGTFKRSLTTLLTIFEDVDHAARLA